MNLREEIATSTIETSASKMKKKDFPEEEENKERGKKRSYIVLQGQRGIITVMISHLKDQQKRLSCPFVRTVRIEQKCGIDRKTRK